jgi:hypothetical protein
MMKRGIFALSAIFLMLAATGFVSAAGLSDFLNSIDSSTIMLFAVFILAFVILYFSLSKVFKGNTTTSGIVSVVLALLITYGINKTGWDIQGMFYGVGISAEILGVVLPIVLLAGVVFLIIKLKKNSLLALGGLCILASFFVYFKTVLIVVGVILIALRVTLFRGPSGGKRQIIIK